MPHVVAHVANTNDIMQHVHAAKPSILVEFWGLPPLIPLLQCVNRLGLRFALSTECYRTRKLGYVNLNWPRCSARVTESLALTDGSFC